MDKKYFQDLIYFWLSLWVWSLQLTATTIAARVVKHTENLSIWKIHSCSNFKLQNIWQNLQNFPFISTVLIAHHFHRESKTTLFVCKVKKGRNIFNVKITFPSSLAFSHSSQPLYWNVHCSYFNENISWFHFKVGLKVHKVFAFSSKSSTNFWK